MRIAAAGLALALVAALLVASAPKPEPYEPDPDARLRFRLAALSAQLEAGAWDEAFATAARLRRDKKADRALVDAAMAVAGERRRHPEPSAWDFDALRRAWRTLAAKGVRGGAGLDRECAAAERMAAALTAVPFDAMRVRAELLARHGGTLVVRRERARLEEIRVRYLRAVHEATRLDVDEPEWGAAVAALEESERLLGGWDPELKRRFEACRAGLADRTVVERALDHVDRAEWARAADLLSRVAAGSHYAKLASTVRANIRLQERLEEAAALYRSGEGARAANRLADLAADWPAGLKNRDLVERLVREVPEAAAEFTLAEKLRLSGDHARAADVYDAVAAEGWYARESRSRAAECHREVARARQRMTQECLDAIDAAEWPRALELFVRLDDAPLVRKRVALAAGAILRDIERRCWSGTFGDAGRAAVALLDAVLQQQRNDGNLDRLRKLKKDYARNIDGRKP